jgi:catechol 2,3-dioxygenase-like lactoylglutathione lyase family enzyme
MTLAGPPFNARLHYATIRTDQLARSVAFYERVLGLPRTRTEVDFVQLDAGGAQLCVDLDHNTRQQPALIFGVDDVAALCSRFADNGVRIVAGGANRRWVLVRDPDGNQIAFEHGH